MRRGLGASRLPDKYKRLNGIYRFLDTGKVVEAIRRTDESARLAEQFGITAYGFFCYSVKVWDQYSDEVVKLRKGTRVLRGGIQLATDHMRLFFTLADRTPGIPGVV